MTNLTDTSYLARICYIPFVLVWMIIRIWQTSRWESFSFLRLIRLEPRSLFTYAFLLALLVNFAHDIIMYSIKLDEGYFFVSAANGNVVFEIPESVWALKNLRLNNISNYLDSISMSFTITSLFTLQIFWSYIMEQMSRKQHTGVWEYWICLVLSLLLLPIFPILTYLTDTLFQNPKYKENIPRLSASGIALILCFIGGLRVHLGIGKLLNSNSRPVLQNRGKLKYFQDLNIWLNLSLFIWSASYIIISIDGILSIIITTRFISDLLISNANFGEFILCICIISIFNPDFSISQKQRVISTPFDVIKTDSSISSVAEILGPNIESQIRVETSQDVKIEHAFINPSYRPYSTTPPISPISNKNLLLTPMPSPSSAFAVGGNQHMSSPLRQSWQQSHHNDVSSHLSQQTLDNDQATLTEHVGRFEVSYDDESLQQETLNEPQIYMQDYNNVYYNNPTSQDYNNTSSYNNNMIPPRNSNDRSNSV